MADNQQPERIMKVKLQNGVAVTFEVEEELYHQLQSNDPSVSAKAKQTLVAYAKAVSDDTEDNVSSKMPSPERSSPERDVRPSIAQTDGNSNFIKPSLEKSVDTHEKWPEAAIRSLLFTFREVEDSKAPIKNKWRYISNQLQLQGHDHGPEACRLKVKSQKEKFMRQEKARNRSGSATPVESDVSEYLEEAFSGLPDVTPVHTLNSESCLKETKKPAASSSPRTEDSTSSVGACSRPKRQSPEIHDTDSREKKHPRRSVDVMKNFLQEHLDKKERSTDARHKEKMAVMNGFLSVMKKLADK